MKKILLVISVAILIALCSAPSTIKAIDIPTDLEPCGFGLFYVNGTLTPSTIYCRSVFMPVTDIGNNGGIFKCQWGYGYIFQNSDGNMNTCGPSKTYAIYCPTMSTARTFTYDNRTIYVGPDLDTYYENIPEEFRPVPSMSERLWDAFYDIYELIFGFEPMPGSLYDLLRNGAQGEDIEITFPTLTPTPTPTPTPSPIPVQTIFVPDGNGNTTIIYQYPDPTTGVITQSPYNPNIENNITVNCDCDGGGGSGTFTGNPQDPYTLDASLLWADGFGVVMSENPLQVVDESQKTLKETAMDYDASVNVLSNSFNVIPLKWIALCGLLGGILIIAGLIRTFLGG